MRFRTGRRKGTNIYLTTDGPAEDDDLELGFVGEPALARLITVAATYGLAAHPELLIGDPAVQAAIGRARHVQAEGPGCPASVCVHPADRHVHGIGDGTTGLYPEAHRCQDCPGGAGVVGP